MNEDKFNPKSPKFNWTALAQRNEDRTNKLIRDGRKHYDSRGDRIQERHAKSDRHQAAMYVMQRKLKGDTRFKDMSVKDMMKGELGERY